jgi:hypothetical protein
LNDKTKKLKTFEHNEFALKHIFLLPLGSDNGLRINHTGIGNPHTPEESTVAIASAAP